MNETTPKYYLGGYYLTKLKPVSFGTEEGRFIYTCSECLNDNMVDTWSFSWTTGNNEQIDEIKERYRLSDEQNGCEPVPWFIAKAKLVISE